MNLVFATGFLMRIAVAVKQVPETRAVRLDEATGTVVRAGVESIVNPLDLYAVETAVRLCAEYGGESVAFSMGPAKADEALREALSMGVDEAVLISDRAFAGSDTWATAYVLAEAIRRHGEFDLILCGERATDGDTGQVGPEVAASLDWPTATYVNHVEAAEGGFVRLTRRVETGTECLLVKTPALVTVVKEIGEPRLPTLRGKQRARSAQIPTLSQSELALDIAKLGLGGSPTRVARIFRPKVTRECERLQARDEPAVEAAGTRFAEFLAERNLLP